MPRRLFALALLAAAAAGVFSFRRRSPTTDASHNGGSHQRAAQLRRELERS